MSRSRHVRAAGKTLASKDRLRTWLRILKLSRRVENELRERFRVHFDTTLPRFDVLSALSRHESGLMMGAVSRELKVSNGNLTGIVDRLAEDGLILRVPVAGDRRATLIRLTKKGRQQFDAQAQAHEQWVDELLGALPATDLQSLMSLLDRASIEHSSKV